MGWFDEGGHGSPVEVQTTLEVGDVWALVSQIVQEGAMVSFGTTSDGGALGVTVTLDGRWRRQYVREGAELEAWLADALVGVKEASPPPTASSGPRQRRRRSG